MFAYKRVAIKLVNNIEKMINYMEMVKLQEELEGLKKMYYAEKISESEYQALYNQVMEKIMTYIK